LQKILSEGLPGHVLAGKAAFLRQAAGGKPSHLTKARVNALALV
jgi:hypothetical protein